ncbi:hypothetical protein ACQP2P_23730 [Dactylosporangium sp. CA-139114]|uniref:hypothetical protein n=1 Tax=Dactylosporangium sp. CA-139114 TaxID=3239931 RepID=UPI003D961A15
MAGKQVNRLAGLAALVAVADAVITVLGRQTFLANAAQYGWAVVDDAPFDGIRQRFVFCVAVAVLAAVVGVGAVFLVNRARPGARLAVVYSLPACFVLDLFTVVYSPGNVGQNTNGESAAEHAEAAAAFDRLFPLWFTGGHAVAVVALGVIALRLVLVLRKPEHRDFYEFAAA